jgi:glycosyltransferase involved in cell wall biosynthesis
LKIAQVAPLFESVPPKLYGGTERIVSYLTEELVRQGHEVTLFASGDSVTSARLRAPCDHALRLDRDCKDPLSHHITLVEQVAREASDFDIVHYHIDYLHFPTTRRTPQRHLTTLHGRLDLPDLQPLYLEYRDMPVISISDAQRKPLPFANWQATVYHGLPTDLYQYQEKSAGYLAFLGRISPEKGVDRAIEIARRAGLPLRIAAKIADGADQDYFNAVIRPMLKEPGVEFIGEIAERDKSAFLGGALAMLFPINWPEPFGLVMIEAMACGTPVVAFPCGSVPEILEPGVNALVGKTIDDLVAAVQHIDLIDRRACRASFERRFSDARMSRDYVDVYRRIAEGVGSWKR